MLSPHILPTKLISWLFHQAIRDMSCMQLDSADKLEDIKTVKNFFAKVNLVE